MDRIDENTRTYFAGEIDHATFSQRQREAWDALRANGGEAEALRTIRGRLPGGHSCETCARPEGAVNHVPGHIFVGWGMGWQPCPNA